MNGSSLLALAFALVTLSSAAQAQECDWRVTKKVDPMTDKSQCLISSASAGIALFADQDSISFVTGSVYARHGGSDGLRVRVDDNPALRISERGRSTSSFEEDARAALREILNGSRLRTSYLDYPSSKSGDAAICTLPQLLADCGAPLGRLKDTRTQAEIIRDMSRNKGGR